MKKIILFLLSINFLWAFPPDAAYFNELLSDDGKVTKNTLKIKKLMAAIILLILMVKLH